MRQGNYDAIVIGAGPAGSAAAILLAQAGWAVALIEQQRFPRRKVCGECIAATNLPLLDALGIGAAAGALAGAPLRSVALWCGDESLHAALPAADDPRHRWGCALGREHLDTLLLERARALGVDIWQPWVAARLDGGPGSFRCELRFLGGEPGAARRTELAAPVAIDAQGSWHARGAARGGDLLAFKANYTGVQLAGGVLPVLAFRGGYGGMVLAGHGIATLACCIRAAQLRRCRRAFPGERAGTVVERYLQSECRALREALAGATRTGAWLAVGPIRPGIHLRAAGCAPFRIGNAAGEVHPLVGEGISMALQSAWLLAGQLLDCREARARGSAARVVQADLQRRYARAWRRQFAARARHAAALAQLAMRPALLRPLLPLVRRRPSLLTRSARWSGKIQCVPSTAVLASLSATAYAASLHPMWPLAGPEDQA